ncbi:MAG: DUF4261 domain-containing protein [Butyrivibrio sp.]|nr:DUF4261 domain-containing protein [Muribaculum sp.]MCM1552805.1 DUF4261 domain-containing protein [Butyrivibrio sp.]
MEEEKVLQQDLSQRQQTGGICPIKLLFREKTAMPPKEDMLTVMRKHLGEVECFSYDERMACFNPMKYKVKFKQGEMPAQLMLTASAEPKNNHVDEIVRSQMWDCPESEEILDRCKYCIIAVNMLGDWIPDYRDRADMLMDFMEAMVELFPECEAVWFLDSGKMFTRDRIVNHKIPREDRFVYFAVNVRFFNIQGTEDSVVDSLGMGTLYLPDVQYHFHGMDPNWVVNHAYNVLSYIYANNAPVASGETIDGIADGHMEQSIQWRCQYEEALIQPAREVMDINMNEYAAGQR